MSPLPLTPWHRADEIAISPSDRTGLRARRCAWCHEDIGRALSRTCDGCGITLHAFCCREAKSCPSLGCQRDWPKKPSIFELLRVEDLVMAIGGAYALFGSILAMFISILLFNLVTYCFGALPRFVTPLWILATFLLFLSSYTFIMNRVRSWAERRAREQ